MRQWSRYALLFPLCTATVLWGTTFTELNLTSNVPGLAANTDPNLKNPWGMSFSATSPFWVSDQGSNLATLYNGAGTPQSLVVSTPPASGVPLGPTGQVFNSTGAGFVLPTGGSALFLFATLAGTIDGWNGTSGTIASLVVPSSGGVYTGLALANSALGSALYAANFGGARIDVFNSAFAPVTLTGNFTDPGIPAGYAPYNIENVGGSLYVEYAQVNPVTHRAAIGAGLGFVSVFDANGNFVKRLASAGPLNAPWGITLAPSSFGEFSNSLLIGNFGDGHIDAFDLSGNFLGALQSDKGGPVAIDGLWALKTRTGGAGVNTNAVYFTAGPNNETNGLFGSIQAIPEPTTLALLLSGAAGLLLYRRRN